MIKTINQFIIIFSPRAGIFPLCVGSDKKRQIPVIAVDTIPKTCNAILAWPEMIGNEYDTKIIINTAEKKYNF